MAKRRPKMTEIRLFIPKSVTKWVDDMVAEGEIGNSRSEVIRRLLTAQKRGLHGQEVKFVDTNGKLKPWGKQT